MSGVNKVILLGRLGKDPEVKHLDQGKVVANFSIATSEVYKDAKGNKKEDTEWHNIVCWNQLAEIIEQYVKKGDMIYIEGKLKTRSWEKDGVTRYSTEILANSIQMLGGNKDNRTQHDSKPPEANNADQQSEDDGGLPF